MVGLRDGLLALGYREDEQFVIGVRFTQGDLAALPAAARELVQHGVDLLFVTAQRARRRRRKWRPTESLSSSPGWAIPWELGLIQSFARPGGNITGVTNLSLDLSPKRLEFFREIIPGLKRVLYPYDPSRCVCRGAGEGLPRCRPPPRN